MRGVAVLVIVLFHAGFEPFRGGFVGVDIFFVISGYLITANILEELEQGKFSIANFYERRARRLLPALFFILLACIPFAYFWLSPKDLKDFSQNLVAISFFASNLFLWRNSGYFDISAELKPLVHTWSLAVEEQFYILFAFFMLIFWKSGKRWILATLGLVFVVSLALAQWASYAKPMAAFYLLPTRCWELLIGVFVSFYLSKANRKEFGKITEDICGWLGVLLICYSVFALSRATPFPGVSALLPTLGSALIILFANQQNTVGKFVGNNALVGLGLVSYSAYLWHQPLFAFAKHGGFDNKDTIFISMNSMLVFILAFFTWKYVEVPFRKKRTLNQTKFFHLGLSFTAFFVIVGYFGHLTNGIENRFIRVLSGNIGQTAFLEYNKYLDEKYFDCEQQNVIKTALVWEGFLRCKQTKRGTPDVIFIGDSHAEDLFMGFSHYMSNKNIAYYINNEKPYIEVMEFKPLFNEILFNNKPQHIILIMNYIERLDAKGTGLYEGFSHTIKSLQKAGKSVTLVGDFPRFRVDPSNCIYNIPNKKNSQCELSIEDVVEQRMTYDSVLDRLAVELKVSYIRIDEALCLKNRCFMSKDDSVMYRDNNHLNIDGSKIFGQFLAERFTF